MAQHKITFGNSVYDDDQAPAHNRALDVDWDLPYEALTPPVLNITGLQDRMFLDHADVSTLAARLPNARLVEMPESEHIIPVERPEALAEQISTFAEGLSE